MSRAHLILAMVVFLSFAVPSGDAIGQATPPPSLSTTPSPPPANQPFAAVLRIWTNPWSTGFWEGLPLQSSVNGNVVEILFDIGCGFVCPPFEPEYQNYSFTMPALPAGNYTVRFVGGFGQTTPPYAQVNLTVGGGVQAPASLPIGGVWSVMLGGLLALFAATSIRRVHRVRRTIV